ncbi:MAG: hypothetical protein FD143_3329 [Ignavibacteria bacterium]|nr:MAG: hypothetical protein FD143_3329 [Ignavibacteria bacterium]
MTTAIIISIALTFAFMRFIWYPIRSSNDFAKLRWECKENINLIDSLKFNLKQLREVIDADCKEINSKQDSYTVSKQS